MKGKVSDRYIAVIPDDIKRSVDENTYSELAKRGFDPNAGADQNKVSRMELAEERGVVYQVGKLAYDYVDQAIEPDCEIGDRVWFVRHIAKIVEDYDNLDSDGHPTTLFVMTPDNLVWNEGREEELCQK